ncbi:MAG TPA: hypothetical protein VF294_10730, partial [Polyangiaceae bacterium]
YKLKEIQPRHWQNLALRAGVPRLWERMQELVVTAAPKVEIVKKKLPREFPKRVIDTIAPGVRAQANIFLAGIGR